jgi:hypothetical protein
MKNPVKFKSPKYSRIQFVSAVQFLVLVFLIPACSPGSPPTPGVGQSGEVALEQQDSSSDSQDSGPMESDPAAQDPSVTPADPCQLLTDSEVETALGEPLASSGRSQVLNYESCDYFGQSGSKFVFVQLTHQNAEQFQKDNDTSTAMLETDLIPVENLGNEAVFYSSILRVRVGETVLQIATWHTADEQDQSLLLTQELAQLAIPRLP